MAAFAFVLGKATTERSFSLPIWLPDAAGTVSGEFVFVRACESATPGTQLLRSFDIVVDLSDVLRSNRLHVELSGERLNSDAVNASIDLRR